MLFFLTRRANSAPLNPLAGFKGPFSRREQRGEMEEKRGRGKEGKKRKEWKKTPQNKFLVRRTACR